MKQKQEGGDNSVNVQGKGIVINAGLSLSDAKEIANDVWKSNFLKMKGETLELVDGRMNWFVQAFISKLVERSPESLDALKEPDVLYSLLQAEIEFARSGEEDLGETLIDLLAERCSAGERSLNAIVLNEAIATVGRLTIGQINALTVYWLVARVNIRLIQSQSQLFAWIQNSLLPLVEYLPKKNAAYEHLSYTGCAQIGFGTLELGQLFAYTYPGLFSKGFLLSEVPSQFQVFEDLFVTCLNDSQKIQIAGMNEDGMNAVAARLGLSAASEVLIEFQRAHAMGSGEVVEMICRQLPNFRLLSDIWASTPISDLTISTVGIAIAHSHWRRNSKGGARLSTWIAEED